MSEENSVIEPVEQATVQYEDRRRFLRGASGLAIAMTGAALATACGGGNGSPSPSPTPTPTPTPTGSPTPTPSPTPAFTDTDLVNFLLNISYLQGQYFAFATTGASLSSDILTGTGTAGTATGGPAVNFADANISQFAREIAAELRAQIVFERAFVGTANAIAQPKLDLSADAAGAFSKLAQSAGIVAAGASFNPYANDDNFLLGAFILLDVSVTAFKAITPLISSKTLLESVVGLIAIQSYHAAMIRSLIYLKGATLRGQSDDLSDARDALDGAPDRDQGVTGDANTANVSPADVNGLAYSRTTGQALSVYYLSATTINKGGFFPDGPNGKIFTSNNAT